MSAVQIDLQALLEAVRNRRELLKMSSRGVAAATGMSPSALSRLADGRSLSVDGFASLVDWLELPAETFFLRRGETVNPDAQDPELHEFPVSVVAHCSTWAVDDRDARAVAVRAVQIAAAKQPLTCVTHAGYERRVSLLAVTDMVHAFASGILTVQPFTGPGARPSG